MPKPLNDMWPGQRFGKLVLIEKCRHPKRSERCWRVKCDCGNERIVFPNGLRKGATASCGCGHREMLDRRMAESNPALTSVRNLYQSSARKRGLIWLVEEHIFDAIVQYPCTYCGAPPSNKRTHRGRTFVYTGIDRQDNSLGYVPGNIYPCCKMCNQAKSNYSLEKFLEWAERVAERAGKFRATGVA